MKSQAFKSFVFKSICNLRLYTIVKSQAFKSLFAYDILQVQLYTLVKSLPSKRMQAINLHVLKLYILVKSQTFKRSIYKRCKGLLPIENLQKDILLSFIPTSTSMLWTILLVYQFYILLTQALYF